MNRKEALEKGKTVTPDDVYAVLSGALVNQYACTGFNRSVVLKGLTMAYKNRNAILDAIPVDKMLKLIDVISEKVPKPRKGAKK